ncbi:MAG TPA: hypothetical protein VFD25_01565 [Clostridia bacterium]|nr:hypothetical protein [Clostridia bacterium]
MSSDKKASKKAFKISASVIAVFSVIALLFSVFGPLDYIAEAFADGGSYTAAANTMRLSYFFDRDFNTLDNICGYLSNSLDGNDDDAKAMELYVRYAETMLAHKDIEKIKRPEEINDHYSSFYSNYLTVLYMKGDTEKAKTKCAEEIVTSGRSTTVVQFLTYVINKGADNDKRWAYDTINTIIDKGPYYDGMDDEIDAYKKQLKSIAAQYKSGN